MERCEFCGESMEAGKRSSRRFCSGKCRKAASRQRHRVNDEKRSRTLTAGEHSDLMEVYAASPSAYKKLVQMYMLFGRGFAKEALDAVFCLMNDAGLRKIR